MENCNLTFSEKAIIEQALRDRSEDRIDLELENKLRSIIKKFESGNSELMTISERMVVIQQMELKLETQLEPDYEEKIKKIIKKLEDF